MSAPAAFPAKLKAVIFDLDGTLVDTADEFVPAVQALRAEHGLAPMAPERIRASVSNGARALVSLGLNTDESQAGFETQRLRLLALYAEVLGSLATVYPGIKELLLKLDRHDIRWGIATNKPRLFTEPLLEALAIEPAPGSVICPEDVAERKPHPESLYRNCRDLGCAPYEAIYIGDHQRDIEAGRRAGMYTVAAGYGYIEPGDDASRWGANACITSSHELASLIFSE